MTIVIEKNKCPGDHECPAVKACPVEALVQNNFEPPVVEDDLCIDCGGCINYCSKGALKLE